MKSLKKILSLILALMMLLTSAFALASCSGDGDNSDGGSSDGSGSGSGGGDSTGDSTGFTYTVYVKSGNKGIAGAVVCFTNVANTSDKKLATTDSNGRAKITTDAETSFKAVVTQVPSDYREAGWSIMDEKTLVDGTATFTYTAVDLPDWTITVVDQNGAPVAGAKVQMCSGSNCFMPKTTDANGTVVFADFVTAEYHVQINSLPTGYVFKTGETKDTYFYLTSTGAAGGTPVNSITVVVKTAD